MVTKVELAKKVEEQEKKLEEQQEENKSLREILAQLEQLLSEVKDTIDKIKDKMEKKEKQEAKEKQIELEEEAPTPNPIILEKYFLKTLKEINRKALEEITLFSGKMDLELIMEQIEGMENHF